MPEELNEILARDILDDPRGAAYYADPRSPGGLHQGPSRLPEILFGMSAAAFIRLKRLQALVMTLPGTREPLTEAALRKLPRRKSASRSFQTSLEPAVS
jgi:hypothetical protein